MPVAAEGARRERAQPDRNRGRGEADHKAAGVFRTRERVGGDSGERSREDGEEHPERMPLHASSLVPLLAIGPKTWLGTLAYLTGA